MAQGSAICFFQGVPHFELDGDTKRSVYATALDQTKRAVRDV